MRKAVLALVICFLPMVVVAQQQTATRSSPPLNNRDVLDMQSAGLGMDIVIAKIKSSSCNFDTSPSELKALRAANVPTEVILAMVQAPTTTGSTPTTGENNQQTTPTRSEAEKESESTAGLVTVQVVGTQTSEKEFTHTTRGTAPISTTNCNSNGTGSVNGNTNGNTTYGTVDTNSTTNCTTETQPGTPPRTHVNYVTQEHVRAIMPDGTHVTLWCQVGFRKCAPLQAGSYSAEVKGNTVWMYVHDLSGKESRMKYKAVGGDW
jgi:hypothetical protein